LTLKKLLMIVCAVAIMLTTDICFAVPECSFTNAGSTLSFGVLDQLSTADATASVSIAVSCKGNPTWYLTSNNGLYSTGSTKRMKHETLNVYIPYILTFSPTTGNKFVTMITGSGLIINSDYVTADVGIYSDTVTITITP